LGFFLARALVVVLNQTFKTNIMKTNRLLRILSLLAFLLLIAPFYDSCDGRGMKQADSNAEATADTTAVQIDSVKIDSTEIDTVKIDTLDAAKNAQISFSDKVYDFIDDEDSSSGFELAYINFGHTGKELKEEVIRVWNEKKWYANLFVYICFIFEFIVLISFSVFILSFTKKLKLLNKLTLINTILTLITLSYIIFLEESFDHFRQIKWGYYAFIIINLLIFYYSKPSKRPT
jgi:hypothetical protein